MENPAAACSSSNVASCSASASYSAYDVFVNHRGPDVKSTFASHLYRRLLDRGLRVFLDKPELEEGHEISSQIEAAIGKASVHIAIFSKNYAESRWCLDELVLMKESVDKSRATILPVFFNVEPSVVGHTDKVGEYAEALHGHESKGRYDSDRIKKWRDTLSYAADLTGFELKAFNGDEGHVLDKLLDSVCEKVAKPLLEGAKYPIGVIEKLKEFEEEFEEIVLSVKTNVVGIVGIGGVGKTTLATAFFNKWRSRYSESSFLSNVRETVAKTSLNSVQSQLLKDLKHKDIEIQSTDQGTGILKRYLLSCHALIIVDDVDDNDQLDALLPMTEILSPQSLILVTSRDKHVLESSGVSSIYNLKGLNTVQSNELFCSYAFDRPLPPPEFQDLVYRFVEPCDGLPLSLKVFGALVCRKDRCYWEGCLDRFRQKLPVKIQQILRISYDSLDKEDQPIFLDIACCFIGEDRELAIKLWGKVAVENLEDKCLLEVDSIDSVYKIKMHDQIRDLGRSIALEASMPRRLCYLTDNIVEWLEQLEQSSSVITEVRGIKMAAQGRSRYTDGEVKRKMSNRNDLLMNTLQYSETSSYKRKRSNGRGNLQFVAAKDGYLERILSRVSSPNLKWLRWHGCPYTRMPPWVPMKDLKVLEVFGHKLEILWEHDKVPCQLRELDVIAPISGFPKSIGQLRYLGKITVEGPNAIETLPEEFCDLLFLKYLELGACSRLMLLPASFGKLTALEYIDLYDAVSLRELPESFGHLSRLKYLSLCGCFELTILNGTFGNITTLEYLNLSYCRNLRVLPSSFGHLSRLKHLSLKGCSNLTISNGTFGNITTLEYLKLSHCQKVTELPSQVGYQRHLVALHFRNTDITELPRGIGGYYSLEALSFGGDFLEELPPWLGDLKSLNELSVYSSRKLTRLPDSFEPFTRLRKLSLCYSGIEYLPQDFAMMKNLETLYVNCCPLRELPFKKVEGETAGRALNKLPSTDHKYMFGLTRLDLRHTDISEVAFPMGVCPNLQHLCFNECVKLRQIGELCGLVKLQYLLLAGSPRVEELSNVETLIALEYLIVGQCYGMKSIQGLEHVMSLKTLSISDCPKLQWGRGVLEQLQQRLQEGFHVQGFHIGELYKNDGEDEDGVDICSIPIKFGRGFYRDPMFNISYEEDGSDGEEEYEEDESDGEEEDGPL